MFRIKSLIGGITLAAVAVCAPFAGAQACMISGASSAKCAIRCQGIKNFWEQAACSLGSTQGGARDGGRGKT